MMAKKSKEVLNNLIKKSWVNNGNSIWLASKLHLRRNFEKFKFPLKLESQRKKQLVSLLKKDIETIPCLKKYHFLMVEDLSPLEKEFFMEHFFCLQSFQQVHSGEAFVISEEGNSFLTINVEDHLHYQLIDTKGDIEKNWNEIMKVEEALGKNFNYSFSPKLGFLTSDLHFCGTGFVLLVFLQPTALVHTGEIQNVLKKMSNDEIMVTGLQSDTENFVGDIYVVRNKATLGLTEENIISSVRIFSIKLMVEEKNVRSYLKHEENFEMKNKVSRAFALLLHSYQTETIESLNALSLLKLGLDLGWIEGITMQDLNTLFFDCRRGHLLLHSDGNLINPEIARKRSEYIHNVLKKARLTI